MNPLYAARRRRNNMIVTFSILATAFGLGWLVLILGALIIEGVSGLSLADCVFSGRRAGINSALAQGVLDKNENVF